MGIQGVPLEKTISINDICTALRKFDGYVMHAAKFLDISHTTIYRKMEQHPELKAVLDEIRKDQAELELDEASHTIRVIMKKAETHPAAAFNCARYLLDSKGKSRGFGRGPQSNTKLENDFGSWDEKQQDAE